MATASFLEASVIGLTNWYARKVPFFFARIGDGAVECLAGHQGKTCDGEQYSEGLAIALRSTIQDLKDAGDQVLWGDWRTAIAGSAPRYIDAWETLVDVTNRRLIHYEALLLMHLSEAQHGFYQAVKRDQRRVLYVGPVKNAGVDHFLACDHLAVPMDGRGFSRRGLLLQELNHLKPQVVLFGAGMAGLIEVVDYWKQDRSATCIHLGSALDPLFGNATRSRQASPEKLRAFYEDLL